MNQLTSALAKLTTESAGILQNSGTSPFRLSMEDRLELKAIAERSVKAMEALGIHRADKQLGDEPKNTTNHQTLLINQYEHTETFI